MSTHSPGQTLKINFSFTVQIQIEIFHEQCILGIIFLGVEYCFKSSSLASLKKFFILTLLKVATICIESFTNLGDTTNFKGILNDCIMTPRSLLICRGTKYLSAGFYIGI